MDFKYDLRALECVYEIYLSSVEFHRSILCKCTLIYFQPRHGRHIYAIPFLLLPMVLLIVKKVETSCTYSVKLEY